jgi:hypothetical protein
MSIRRKTCETMTLLYEAALKTNPEIDDIKDRPTPINPTPGVLPREEVGKAIWIKDPTKPTGGYWLAGNEQEAKSSGISADYVIVGNVPEKTMGEVERGLFGEVQSGRNVNPQINGGVHGAEEFDGQCVSGYCRKRRCCFILVKADGMG